MGYVNKHGDIIQLLSPVRYVESPEGGPLFFFRKETPHCWWCPAFWVMPVVALCWPSICMRGGGASHFLPRFSRDHLPELLEHFRRSNDILGFNLPWFLSYNFPESKSSSSWNPCFNSSEILSGVDAFTVAGSRARSYSHGIHAGAVPVN